MTSWPGKSPSLDNARGYWRAFQTSLCVTVVGGLASLLLGSLASKACRVAVEDQNTLLTRYSLPVLTLATAFLVMTTISSSTDSPQPTVATGQIKTWIAAIFLLTPSVIFVDGISQISRIVLAASLLLFLGVSVLYFFLLIHVAYSQQTLLLAVALLAPGVVNAMRGCVSSTSTPREVMIQTGITSLCCLAMLSLHGFRSSRIRLEQTSSSRLYAVVIPFLTVSLFFGALTIPVGMGDDDKSEYLNVVAASRLSIFAVSTFLLVSSPLIINGSQNAFTKLIIQRRIGVITAIIAVLSIGVAIVYLPIAGTDGELTGLSILVASVSAVFSLLLPWFLVRLRENRFNLVDIIALGISSALVLIFRRNAFEWQLVSLVVLLVLVLLFSTRHLHLSRQILHDGESNPNRFSPVHETDLVSVVVPSFNPGSEVIRTISRIRTEFQQASLPCEIIVVSDGSTDESTQLLEECPDIKEHIWLRTNHGKGAALREGFAQSDGSIVCFIDADGDLDPSVLPSMVRQIKQQKFDIVYGSKLHALSNVEMSRFRRMISSGFRLLVKLLFRFDVSDTQTGVKVFSGSLIREALPLASENGFNIDLELFVVAHALGYQRFGSHPIILHRKGESSVGLTTVFQMLFSTLRLFRRRTLTLDYVPVGKVL